MEKKAKIHEKEDKKGKGEEEGITTILINVLLKISKVDQANNLGQRFDT